MVADGFWIMLRSLHARKHELHCTRAIVTPDGDFRVEVAYPRDVAF